MSISVVTLSFVQPGAVRPPTQASRDAADAAPSVPATASTPGRESPRLNALAQAVSVAAKQLASAGSSEEVDAAARDFTRVLAHALHAARRSGGDHDEEGEDRHRHDHGRHHGHRHGHRHDMSRHYEQWSGPGERLQAYAARLERQAVPAASVPGAPAVPVAAAVNDTTAPDAAITSTTAADPAVVAATQAPGPAETAAPLAPLQASAWLGHGPVHRLLDAFQGLQKTLGLTPSEDPQAQRQALAGFLESIASALRGGTPSAALESAPTGTGLLLQEAA